MLVIGAEAPTLTGETQSGPFGLAALRGRPVVVYFYPKDATTGCTTEARDFRDAAPAFQALGVTIVGVSRDTVRSHARFAEKECLPFPLVSDADGAITERWGVWREKKLYGKVNLGIVRSTFLVGPDGRLAAVWDPARVNGHVAAVLEAARALKSA